MSKSIKSVIAPLAGAAGGFLLGGPLGAALGPALGSLAPAAGIGLGAGLGYTAGGVASGQSLGDSLKGGALSGLGAGVLSSLGNFSATPQSVGPSVGASPGGASAASAAGPVGGAGAGAVGGDIPIDLSMIPEGQFASIAQEAGVPAYGAGGFGTGLATDLGISPGQLAQLNNFNAASGVLQNLGYAPDIASVSGYIPSGTGLATDLGATLPSATTPTGVGTAVLDQNPLLGGSFQNTSTQLPGLDLGGSATASTAAKGAFDYSGSTLGKIMSQLGLPQNSVTEAIAKNPNLLLAGGGLAANMLMGQGKLAGEDQLRALADQANSRAGANMNGQLPAGAQAGLDQGVEAAKAAIRAKYAGMNLSGSTMEQQELNNIDMQKAAQGFQMTQQLVNQGIQEAGLASNIYRSLLGLNAQRDANTGNAISNFAAALNG